VKRERPVVGDRFSCDIRQMTLFDREPHGERDRLRTSPGAVMLAITVQEGCFILPK
jgi:hypothetical protein